MSMKMAKKLFLSDEPIKELTEDAFGHKAFVETLYRCVKNCDSKINIGLFGSWGVGKTSIINLLIKKFESDDQKIKSFFFDAWKYSHGSLRQELVLRLNKEYKIIEPEKLEKEIYCIQEEEAPPVEGGWKNTLRRILARTKILWSTALSILTLLFVLHSLHLISVDIYFWVLLVLLFPMIVQLVIAMNSAASSTGKIRVLPTKFDPERLEKQFNQIADGIVKRNKADKLVIVIDNLDRCSSEAAIEMLEAIKTLMGHDKCVYLLPCDDSALIKHLVSVRKYEEKDARQFLKKFFQTSLTIPSFLGQDLEEFASSQLSELEIEYSQEVLQVIVSAFMENPRRIKQFLNNLTMQYLAAEEREKAGIIGLGDVTQRDGFLAKILVIRQEYLSFYEELESNEGLLDEIETYFRKRGEPPVYKNGDRVFDDNPGLEQFLRSTRPITVEDISPFLKLNRETYPSTIPDAKEFKLQVNNGNVDYILSSLDKLKQEEDRIEYIRRITRVIDSERQARNYAWVFNGVDILTKIYEQIPAAARHEIAAKIGYYMTLAEIRANLGKFDYSKSFPILREVEERHRIDILNEYSALLSVEKIDQDLIDQFVELYDLLPGEAIDNLNGTLIQAYTGKNEEAIMTIRKLNQTSKVSERLISRKLVTTVEESIDTSVTSENTERITLYLELRGRSDTETKLSFLNKVVSIIGTSRNNTYDEAKRLGLETLMKLDPDDVPSQGVQQLHDMLSDFTGLMNRPVDKLEFVKVFFRFFVIFLEQQREQFLKAHIVPLVSSGDAPILRNILDEAKEYGVRILSYDFVLDEFSNRVQSNLPDVELIKYITVNTPKKNKEKIKEALVALISNPQPPYHNAGLESFTQLYTEFVDTQVGEICDACLDRSKQVATPEKGKLIHPILEAFERCPVGFKSTFTDHTLEFIRSEDIDIRDMGIECFGKIENLIGEDKKRWVIIQLLHTINQRASQDKIDEGSKPLLDLLVKNQAILVEEDTVDFVDTLTGLLSKAKGKDSHLIGLEYLGRIRKLYRRRDSVIKTVEEDLESEDEDIKQQAKQTLELLKASSKESTKTSPEEAISSEEG